MVAADMAGPLSDCKLRGGGPTVHSETSQIGIASSKVCSLHVVIWGIPPFLARPPQSF